MQRRACLVAEVQSAIDAARPLKHGDDDRTVWIVERDLDVVATDDQLVDVERRAVEVDDDVGVLRQVKREDAPQVSACCGGQEGVRLLPAGEDRACRADRFVGLLRLRPVVLVQPLV